MTSKTLNRARSIFSITLLGFTGCFASPKPWEITHPASGTVEFKGKPIENAELTLFPTDANVPESVRPKAKSIAGGKFVLGTYSQSDGAPVGKYKVTVVRNEVSVSKDTIVAKPNDLPNKYSLPNTTDIVLEIAEGKNELPTIVLK
ncbi:MAG: hypothetical protein MUC83_04855 [Pirellula sp.]|jgi:hypothetical protein|nr:hypothetical protein [Pirellula sp.]